MTREFRLDARFEVTTACLDALRAACSPPSGRTTWIDQRTRLVVHTLRGVPGRLIDVLLPESSGVYPPPRYAMEVGCKTGCFDAATRWRIAVRPWPHFSAEGKEPSVKFPGRGKLAVEDDLDDGHTTLVATWWGGGIWAQSFARLRYRVDTATDLDGVFMHHYYTYYRFLPEEDARQACAYWSVLPLVVDTDDLVVLNRTASTILYDLARQLGWRKLTLREKRRLGLTDDAPQWQRADYCAARIADMEAAGRNGTPTGAGQYSHNAAAGRTMRTAYGIIDLHE